MKIDREWAIHESDIGCDGQYLSNAEIVRCKDCIHRMENGMCEYKDYRVVAQEDDDFCSWGERKETETKEEQL